MDIRLKKLKINLPSHWAEISDENPDGPPTFINSKLEDPSVLQISLAEYVRGEKPNPDYNDLIQLSESVGIKHQFGEIKEKDFGDCKFVKYAYVQFSRIDFPYIIVWHLSNGKDFIF